MRIAIVDLKYHKGVTVIRTLDTEGNVRMLALQGTTISASRADHKLIPPFVLPRDLPGGHLQWDGIMKSLEGDDDVA